MRHRLEDLGRIQVLIKQMMNMGHWDYPPIIDSEDFQSEYYRYVYEMNVVFDLITDIRDIAEGIDELNRREQ